MKEAITRILEMKNVHAAYADEMTKRFDELIELVRGPKEDEALETLKRVLQEIEESYEILKKSCFGVGSIR